MQPRRASPAAAQVIWSRTASTRARYTIDSTQFAHLLDAIAYCIVRLRIKKKHLFWPLSLLKKNMAEPFDDVSEWASEWASEWVSEWVSQWVSEWVIPNQWAYTHMHTHTHTYTHTHTHTQSEFDPEMFPQTGRMPTLDDILNEVSVYGMNTIQLEYHTIPYHTIPYRAMIKSLGTLI